MYTNRSILLFYIYNKLKSVFFYFELFVANFRWYKARIRNVFLFVPESPHFGKQFISQVSRWSSQLRKSEHRRSRRHVIVASLEFIFSAILIISTFRKRPHWLSQYLMPSNEMGSGLSGRLSLVSSLHSRDTSVFSWTSRQIWSSIIIITLSQLKTIPSIFLHDRSLICRLETLSQFCQLLHSVYRTSSGTLLKIERSSLIGRPARIRALHSGVLLEARSISGWAVVVLVVEGLRLGLKTGREYTGGRV